MENCKNILQLSSKFPASSVSLLALVAQPVECPFVGSTPGHDSHKLLKMVLAALRCVNDKCYHFEPLHKGGYSLLSTQAFGVEPVSG